MSFPEIRLMDLPLDALGTTVTVATGEPFDARQLTEKGYDWFRGAGAAFTANLEGSVTGATWTVIVALAASGQGAVPVHYNYLRVNCSVQGALGTGTRMLAAGKAL